MQYDCVDIVAGFKLGDRKCRNYVSGGSEAQEMGLMGRRGLEDEEDVPVDEDWIGGTQSYLSTPGGSRPQWLAGEAGRSFAVRHWCAQRRAPPKHPGKGGFGGTDLRPLRPLLDMAAASGRLQPIGPNHKDPLEREIVHR